MRPVQVPTINVADGDHAAYRLRLLWCVFQHICTFELGSEMRRDLLEQLSAMLPEGPERIQPEKDQIAEILNELDNPSGIHLNTGAAIQRKLMRRAANQPPSPPSPSQDL